MQVKNIVLIGFMGVGKGSVAREIVKQSKYIAVDTDDLIESMENRRVKKIFAKEGEAYFRNLEQKIAKWLEHSVHDTLISTGGGFFKVPDLNKIGKVILLHAEFDTIYNRILSHPMAKVKLKKRPLFTHPKEAKKLYNEREKIYKKVADVIVNVEGKSLEKIVREIAKKSL